MGAEARPGWAVLSASLVMWAARSAAAIEVELAAGEGGWVPGVLAVVAEREREEAVLTVGT